MLKYEVLALSLTLLIGLAIVTWITWIPVKRVSMVEFEVQQFRREMREWESGNSDDR
jgi:hypothetical protein